MSMIAVYHSWSKEKGVITNFACKTNMVSCGFTKVYLYHKKIVFDDEYKEFMMFHA